MAPPKAVAEYDAREKKQFERREPGGQPARGRSPKNLMGKIRPMSQPREVRQPKTVGVIFRPK